MTRPRKPFPPEIAAARGLAPAERARAIAVAKPAAFRLVHAVKHRNAQGVQQCYDSLSREEWAAVAVVLAECVDLQRLEVLKHVPDDGMPEVVKLRGVA